MTKRHFLCCMTLAVALAGCDSRMRPSGAPFDPGVHGFSFQNYTNDTNPTNLTPAELHRMFGDAICARGTGPTCTLTPPAQQWMEQTNSSMAGGHCEGMAVLSARMHGGAQMASTFGGATPFMLRLEGNADLQREIGY